MFNIKSNKNKFLATTVIEILFTIILILLLIFIRQKSIGYLYDIQNLSGDINNLEQNLQTQNLTSYDKEQAKITIDKVDSVLTKGLFLIRIILPISIIILSLLFYFVIWKIISNISIKRFFYASIIPLVIFLTFVYFSLNYIAYKFYFVEDSPLIQLIIATIILIIIYYFSLILLSNKKQFIYDLGLGKNHLKNLLMPFMFNLLTNLLYIVLVFVLFFLSYVKAPLIIPSITLFILILIINFQRIHLANKISKLS